MRRQTTSFFQTPDIYTQTVLLVTDDSTAQAKWESLRDAFKKNVAAREKATRSGAGHGKEPRKYKYFDQLEWLLAVGKKKSTISNYQPNDDLSRPESMSSQTNSQTPSPIPTPPLTASQSPSTSNQLADAIPSHLQESTPTLPTPSTQPSTASGSTRKRPKKADVDLDEEASIKNQIASTGELINTLIQQSKERPKDNDALFGEMLADELRSIPSSYQKDMLKLNIQQQVLQLKYSEGSSLTML